LSLTIDDLAFGGEGVGRADGYVVFVRGGVPGDRLRVRLDQARSRFGRGRIEAIETPSPHRIEAPCPYFGRCGGCRLQHVDYQAQLSFKAKQVADALERLGGLGPVDVRPISPPGDWLREQDGFTIARTGMVRA
jgi:23S rRNA (uracil1939-C5)-methyltransferase